MPQPHLTRTSRDWVPPDDDEYTYVKRHGRWVRLDDGDDDVDEDALEEFEDRRRQRIAERNEY